MNYKGYEITFSGCSYSCPALKLYGYSLDTQLFRAIDRKLKAQAK